MEPFLFIGVVAAVRRVLVLTAEFESGTDKATEFLIQIGAMAGLALALVVSIYVLRRSARSGNEGVIAGQPPTTG